MLYSTCQQTWKTQPWPQDWKRSVFIPIPKKGNARECSNYHTIALISHTSKLMLKILQARLQQNVNWQFPDVKAGFRKGRGTRNKITNICRIIEKAKEFQKNIYFCFFDYAKAFDCVGHKKNCGKFFKRWGYQTTWPASWESCMQVKMQQLELHMEQLPSRFSRVRLCMTPWMAAHEAPLSLGFSRQEHWSGLPFPSPVHGKKWKWSRPVVSDS